jgi:hypothetical protein
MFREQGQHAMCRYSFKLIHSCHQRRQWWSDVFAQWTVASVRTAADELIKRSNTFMRLVLFSLLALSGAATADMYTLSVGAEYISGDFGGDTTVTEWYLPVTGKYITNQHVFRITVPYSRLDAPAGTTITGGTGGQPTGTGTAESTTAQGLGDIVASMTVMDVLDTEFTSGVSLDLTGKIKFATADEAAGLGTGENDYSVNASLLKFGSTLSPYAVLGYTFRGDPPGTDLMNVWSVLAGGTYHVTPVLGASLDYYYCEPSSLYSSGQKEVTALLNYRISRNYGLQGYVLRGLSDGSPDWGMGVIVSVTH